MVYVDDARIPYEHRGRRMLMSHMMADTLKELHEMAHKIGVSRRHFQNNPDHPHYDICQSYKARAIRLGAKLVTQRELVILSWRISRGADE